MSKPGKFDDIDLMLYVDGELDDETAARVAELVEADEDAGAKVESLRQMDDVLASYLELEADDQEHRLDAMWSSIERGIKANGVAPEATPEATRNAAREADEAKSRAVERRPQTRPAEQSGGIWGAINRWLDGYRGHVLTGAATVAAAALLIIAIKSSQTVVVNPPAPTPVNNNGAGLVPAVTPCPPQAELGSPRIDQLDVTDGSSTVFIMPSDSEDDVSATVIFVDMNEVMNDSEEPL